MLYSKNYSNVLVFLLIFMLVFLLTGITGFSETIILRYSDSDPPGGMRPNFIKEIWLAEIVKQTNGQVEIQDFWGSALLGPSESLKGCRDGVTDMTIIFSTFYPEQLLSWTIWKVIPEFPKKFENIAWVYRQAYEQIPLLKKELEKWNQKLLMFTAPLPVALAATYPIDSIEDIIGYKWRAGGRWHLSALNTVGAIAISVPFTDTYMALSTGTVDGVVTNYDAMEFMKFYEVAPNILVGTQLLWANAFFQTINLDKWNSLPEDVQEGIMEASRIAEEKFGAVRAGELEKQTQRLRDLGVTVNMMDKDDIELFAGGDFQNNMQNVWIEEMEKAGVEDAAHIMDQLKLIVDEGIAREEANK